MLRSIMIFGLAVCLGLCILSASTFAAPTPAQRQQAAALSTSVTKADNLAKQGKFKESADTLKEVQGKLDKLGENANKDMVNALSPLFTTNWDEFTQYWSLEGISSFRPSSGPMEKAADAIPAGGSGKFGRQRRHQPEPSAS